MTGCAALAALARQVAIDLGADADPATFVEQLAEHAAGVRPGPLGLVDLATGGRNRIRGGGFAPQFDDATRGQARHFAGTAAAAMRLGDDFTRLASLVRDPTESPDARLTEKALDFVRLLGSGELRPADAGDWIERELCASGA